MRLSCCTLLPAFFLTFCDVQTQAGEPGYANVTIHNGTGVDIGYKFKWSTEDKYTAVPLTAASFKHHQHPLEADGFGAVPYLLLNGKQHELDFRPTQGEGTAEDGFAYTIRKQGGVLVLIKGAP